MTSEKKTEIIVGVVVFFAILIITFGLIWGKGVSLFSERKNLKVRFETVQGLEKGDPVVIRGIKKGEIQNIYLTHDYAEVQLWIQGDIPLTSDTRFILLSREIMGGKQISVYLGESTQPLNYHVIHQGEIEGDIWALMNKGEAILASVDSVFRLIHEMVDTKRISNILQHLESVTLQAKNVIVENRVSLKKTIHRLDRLTQQFDEENLVKHVGELVVKLDSTVVLMKRAALRLENEEGTLGKLLRDRWLYDQLLETTTELDSLIGDIKANPKKYIHFSIF